MSSITRYMNLRALSLVAFYTLVLSLSYFAAYELRFDFNVPDNHSLDRIETIWWVVGLQMMLLIGFGQFDSILAYFRLPDAVRLFSGLLVAASILASMWFVYEGAGVPPRAVILTDFLICFLLLASFRVLMRVKASRGLADWLATDQLENVLIVGAGEVGAGLCSDLMQKSALGMRPVAFLDDDVRKVGRYVHGVLVAGVVDDLVAVAKRYAATKVVVAFPSASVKRVKVVANLAREAGLLIEIVPALTDLVSGRAEISQLRPIELQDLLGRDTVDLHSDAIRSMLEGKRVLITGAGGSIGSELVRQVIEYAPRSVHCVDQTEIAVFNLQEGLADLPEEMSEDVAEGSDDGRRKRRRHGLSFSVMDVAHIDDVSELFDVYRPEVVFHAAAHKHVNLMEYQPAEALRNNFYATAGLAVEASRVGVERFILISSDKAINPTSVMGATKRLAELSLLEQNAVDGNTTKFMAVRFGNVLGSSGSVVPIFRRQIAAGGPITVTDPEVTRFFMTVEEAVGLVLESATQGEGGEIFVLNMGESIKVVDVARQMIALSGLREGIDIDIEIIGLRPGEKLYEEVQHLSEELQPTEHPRVLRFVANSKSVMSVSEMKVLLNKAIESHDVGQIKQSIHQLIPEYTVSL
ncbi:MAG: nucleoside-diphosphate sugar epimerase/dehydratase [Lentimonas sp.]